MASSNVSRTVVNSLKSSHGRNFAAVAAAQAKDVNASNCSIKKLNNGVHVGVISSNSPIARVAVVAHAGSRFENGDNLGISHFLRMSTKMRTQNMTSLAMTRTVQQVGADVSIMGTREYIYFKSAVTRNCLKDVVAVLQDLTTKQAYQPWEVADAQKDQNGMSLDLALLSNQPHVCAVEMLHSAAFRNVLGNSLYAPEHMVGGYSADQILQYVKTYFSIGRLAVIGIGVDEAELHDLASAFEPYASAGVPTEKATYHGGEVRNNCGGNLAHVAVGFQGPSLTSKELLAYEVLRHILGSGPHIKYSSGNTSNLLAKAAAGATDAPFHVSALNATYSDNGLFGFTAVAHASQIDKVVQAAANQFKNMGSGITDKDIARGKSQLKAEICMHFENPDVLLNWLGEQAFSGQEVVTPEDIYKMVDGINATEVKSAASNVLKSRPSMSAIGNTSNVPYLDKLFS